MNVYLLRHGIAAALGTENNHQDELRALTPEGESKMRKAAQGLQRLGVELDLIASSPLVRARQSAEIVAEVLKFRHPVLLWPELEPGEPLDRVLKKLRGLPDRNSAMLAGHQPSIGYLASYLLFGSDKVSLPFKKGAIFSIQLSEVPRQETGELRWMLTSKMMRQIAEL
jgi:phosphohistidine phosphatase